MSTVELELNTDVLKRWVDTQNCDPAAALVVATGISIPTARKILRGEIPKKATRRLVSLSLNIPEETLWKPKAA